MARRLSLGIVAALVLIFVAASLAYVLWFSEGARMAREAKTAAPVIRAVKKHFAANGAYPTNTAQLKPDLPGAARIAAAGGGDAGSVDGWRYFPEPGNAGFSLRRKVGWDASLVYRWDGTAESWVLDPGDGGPPKTVHP